MSKKSSPPWNPSRQAWLKAFISVPLSSLFLGWFVRSFVVANRYDFRVVLLLASLAPLLLIAFMALCRHWVKIATTITGKGKLSPNTEVFLPEVESWLVALEWWSLFLVSLLIAFAVASAIALLTGSARPFSMIGFISWICSNAYLHHFIALAKSRVGEQHPPT